MTPRSPVTLSSENGHSRIQPSLGLRLAANVAQRPAHVPRRPFPLPTTPSLIPLEERRP
jgi:hypothetical protein